MSIFDFLTQDQIDDLPDDDDEGAFLKLVNHATRKLSELTAGLDESQEHDWAQIRDYRYSFVNVIAAAAQQYRVRAFEGLDIPEFKDFDSGDYRKYRDQLDHYVTQAVLAASIKARRTTVQLSPDTKVLIRKYTSDLREIIERAELDGKKREALLDKLAAFEAELEKKRFNLVAVTMLAIGLLGAPGALAESGEVAFRLLGQVFKAIAEAKAEEDNRTPLPDRSGERPSIVLPRRLGKRVTQARESFSADLDDEIPF